jgi:hypothetical protein
MVLLFVLTTPALSLPLAAFPIEQASRRTQWRVKYEEGTEEIDKGTKMTVTVNKQNIVGETGKRDKTERLVIPVGNVSKITYSVEFRPLASRAFGDRDVWRSVDDCSGGDGLAAAFCLAAYGILSLGDLQKHFVGIAWQEDNYENFVIFRVSKADYTSFLTALETSAGKQRKDLWEEREKFLQSQWHPTSLPQQEWNHNLRIKPAQAWVSGLGRCQVLATDSDEYRKNCASGTEAVLRLAYDTPPYLALKFPMPPSRLLPEWVVPTTPRGE